MEIDGGVGKNQSVDKALSSLITGRYDCKVAAVIFGGVSSYPIVYWHGGKSLLGPKRRSRGFLVQGHPQSTAEVVHKQGGQPPNAPIRPFNELGAHSKRSSSGDWLQHPPCDPEGDVVVKRSKN